MKRIAIIAAQRTPIGSFQGQFSPLSAPQLGSAAIKAALNQTTPLTIDEAFIGNVLSAGIGQAPARQAVLGAGLPNSVPCTTVNKVCGSGMKAIMLGCDAIANGQADSVLAGGMESMTNAPYLLPTARAGMRMGNQTALDSMIHDGLWDPYGDKHMGQCGETCAEKYKFTREGQDGFAIESLQRARRAQEEGFFKEEIAPVTVKTRKSETTFDTDEQVGLSKIDKIPTLRPAFKKDGTITAANASSISDGAAAVILVPEDKLTDAMQPLAFITGYTSHAQEPEWFTTAPVGAIQKLLMQLNLGTHDIDLWEINEAFAVVTMAAMHDLKLDHIHVNVHGGATALGHPIGCSGARLVVTLLAALRTHKKKRGIASLCIGGGEATALCLEAP